MNVAMKRTVSLCLALFLVCLTCMAVTSCEQVTAYTQLRDYLEEQGPRDVQAESGSVVTHAAYDSENRQIILTASLYGDSSMSLVMILTDDKGEYAFSCETVVMAVMVLKGSGTLKASAYDGSTEVVFDTFEGTSTLEYELRQVATVLMNGLLLDLDVLCHEVNLSVTDFGFEILPDKYQVSGGATAEEDMGGPFSAARLAMAGQMILIGLGMVFLVLAILWGVLIIFKKVMYDIPQKKARIAEAAKGSQEAPEAPPEETASGEDASASKGTDTDTDEGALVAAITAAVAAAIAADEGLSSQFADGFRVVSFRKKTDRAGSGAVWNR